LTLGHEYSGRVAALGDGVDGVQVGDRVCGDSCLRCNRCRWCLRGEYNICRVGGSVGLHLDGAFARYLVVPAYTLVKLSDAVPFRTGALVEPLAVGLHAVAQGRLEPGDTLVVLGLGMIGCATLLAARARGASEVLVVEPREERARMALDLGATRVLPADLEAARHEVRADVVVDCTGRAELAAGALELTRRGGRLVLAGIPHAPSMIDLSRVVYYEREVIGALGYRFDLERAVALIAAGRLDPGALLAPDPIPLDTILQEGFERSLHDEGAPPRIFVTPV
jgi:(R,R)-butanediol dehydrogenase/meso-butanediol dehydrogenase/diacetyl reductase